MDIVISVSEPTKWFELAESCDSIKDYISMVRSHSCRVLRVQSSQWLKSAIVNAEDCLPLPLPSCSHAVGSGPVAAECILWRWKWLAKNCARVKRRLNVRAELPY